MGNTKFMQRNTHKLTHKPATAIAILRDAVDEWRRGNHWSRETVAQMVVEAHERIDAPLVTGMVFDPQTRDHFERMRVNADRIFRWLDDVSKDRNHLPLNMLASVLSALPLDLRLEAASRILRPADITARAMSTQAPPLVDTVLILLRRDLIETAEANAALTQLVDGIDDGELEHAQRQVSDAIEALSTTQAAIDAAITAKSTAGRTHA